MNLARDSQKPAISGSNLESTASSEDLLKDAWASMGRTETGERVEESGASASGSLTSAANKTSSQSDVDRSMTAEEIARLLSEETGRRSTAETQQRPPQPAPQRQRQPQLRPRRAAPTAPPPTRSAPQPTTVSQPPRVPADQAPARRRRGFGWGIFALFWLVASFVGSFLDNVGGSDTPDISIDIPEVTIDFSDLTSTTLGVVGNGTAVNIRDIEPGTCIDTLPIGDIVSDVATVSCDTPHQYELYANTQLAGDDFPGPEVFDLAFEACSVLFFDYVGEAYATSTWYVDVIAPTEEGWTKVNDRAVNCLIYQWDEDAGEVVYLTGTAEGSGDASS